jgi:hypothetical protein
MHATDVWRARARRGAAAALTHACTAWPPWEIDIRVVSKNLMVRIYARGARAHARRSSRKNKLVRARRARAACAAG